MAKGSFATAGLLNPIRTGATIEVRAGDGRALYRATLQGWAFRSDRGHRTFRYVVPHGRAPPGARGIKRLRVKLKEGAADFLTKPVQEDQFIAAVGRLIGAPAGMHMEQAAAGQ